MKRAISSLLCIIVTASLLASCNSAERPLTVGELLDLGEKYLLDLNYEQAIVCFTRAIEIEPNNTRAYMGRGAAYTALKRYDEAIQDYTRVIEIDAGIPEAYIRLADVYLEIGEIEEAEKTLRNGLAALPGNAELEIKLDTLLQGQSSGSGAEQEDTASGSGAAQSPSGDSSSSPETLHSSDAHYSNYEKAQYFLSDMLAAYKAGGYESLYDVMESEEYLGVIIAVLENRLACPVIFIDESVFYGVGIYKPGGGVIIYIGGYSGEARNGFGIWVPWSGGAQTRSRFEGEWVNDLPNGAGMIVDSGSMPDGTAWTSTRTGYLVDGLWDGEVTEKREPIADNTDYVVWVFEKGKFKILGGPDDRGNDVLWYQCEFISYYTDGSVTHGISVTENRINDLHGVWGIIPMENYGW